MKLLLSLAMVAFLAACGSNQKTADESAAIEDMASDAGMTAEQLQEKFSKVYFDFDSSTLSSSSKSALGSISDALKATTRSITIAGHTDSVGATSYNYNLGLKRANKVKDFLVSQGADAAQITVVSEGEKNPAKVGNRSMNRRVEFMVK